MQIYIHIYSRIDTNNRIDIGTININKVTPYIIIRGERQVVVLHGGLEGEQVGSERRRGKGVRREGGRYTWRKKRRGGVGWEGNKLWRRRGEESG